MKKICFLLFFTLLHVNAQKLDIVDFQTDVYSKNAKEFSKKINLSVVLVGRDVEEGSYKVVDALNVIIGSFYVEDLLTSKGKEAFKKALIQYSSRKYSVEIDEIYIQNLYIVHKVQIDEIIQAIKEQGCFKETPKVTKKPTMPSLDDDIINFE